MKFALSTITRIFCSGQYVWELVSPVIDPASKIKELHEGSFLDHIFYPGISVSMSGKHFKVTRWGIGNLPMSGNSFVHLFVGEIFNEGSNIIVRGRFRLNAFVFGFTLFWLTAVYLSCTVMVVGLGLEYLADRDATKLLGLLFGLAFPIVGTVMLLGFRGLAQFNEREILAGLKAKFGEPVVKPEQT